MGKKKKTIQEVREYINNEGYTLLSDEYINCNQELEIICPNGHNIKMSWKRFENGRRCPHCSERSWINRKKNIEYINEIISKEGYKFLEEYTTAKTKMKCSCPNGHIFEINWNNFKNGKRCPLCNRENKSFSYEQVKEIVSKENYKLISKEYKNSKEKIELKCSKGHIYSATFDSFKRGKRCPHCISSKGENKVKEVLINNNIEYIQQYKFKDCKNINALPFDFYLPKYNIAIEYDGEQHYKIIDFGGKDKEVAKKEFENRKKCDNIKTQYCLDNNIKLIRIPYWEYDNIEKIIKNKLNINK